MMTSESGATAIRDAQSMEAIYRLRHQVFTEELGFFTPSRDGQERDEHDAGATHLGQWLDGELVACVRLVFRRPLPCESWCSFAGGEAFFDGMRVAEISRICLNQRLRRSSGLSAASRLTMLNLFEGIAGVAKDHRLTHVVAAMEAPLVQRFQRMGLDFYPVGPEVDYFGPVRPWALRCESGLAQVPRLAALMRIRHNRPTSLGDHR